MLDFINENLNIKELYLNETILNKVIKDFKEEILNNKETLLELYKIDSKVSQMVLNIDSIMELLDLYKNEKIEKKEKELIVASYVGSPYITINLCMQALTKKRGTIAIIEDSMLGINKLLISIFNSILEDYKISKLIELYNNVNIEDFKKIQENVDYIVCIGNTYTYYKFVKKEIKNLRYVPFKNFALFCDNQKFEDIKYETYKYSLKMGIEAEVYEYLDEFIECVNDDETLDLIVIFSEDENEIERFIQDIKSIKKSNIYINENPFKNEKFKITIE